jgi:hypothetical protein
MVLRTRIFESKRGHWEQKNIVGHVPTSGAARLHRRIFGLTETLPSRARSRPAATTRALPCPAAPAHSRGAEEAPCDESTGNESHYNDLHPGVTETATRPRRVLP